MLAGQGGPPDTLTDGIGHQGISSGQSLECESSSSSVAGVERLHILMERCVDEWHQGHFQPAPTSRVALLHVHLVSGNGVMGQKLTRDPS